MGSVDDDSVSFMDHDYIMIAVPSHHSNSSDDDHSDEEDEEEESLFTGSTLSTKLEN
jgi:hypothetical protein